MILGERVIEVSRDNKTNVLQRLKRIEGQIKGVQRMVEEEAPCLEILTQIAAARGAMAQVGKAVFSSFSTTCLREALEEGKDEGEAMEELMEALDRLLK
ncbi:MAG: metal-sensitive transcriptional regulator [Firmicutes bacterium]|jgi:DNA-binding FrmR family transcriptional regulator|nr:metal-sensitive transcriptional regulator [Bacillota bacterium]NLO65561.1 metal-sensitive transcriptional regulator [Bacillota bacterium]